MQESTQTEGKAGGQMQAVKKAPDKTSEIDEHISARFDVKKRLGKGAYGIVWKAVDRKTGEVVAIKKIFDAFRNQTDAQRTYREIFFLQAFRRHPNVIKLHSIHRALNNRDIYLGFEYMQTDLHNVIKCGNILKDIHKRYIMYQMLRATKYIHSGNVIHRDQKPSNVLIDNACRVKIADFGLARSVATHNQGIGQGGADPCLTDYVATRWYRAPEILIASRSYTKGVDMWSLGCILGEMLVGKPLFPGSSTVNQIERIMSCIPQPSEADICAVCTGYGSSLIRTAVKRRISLREILGNAPSEAVDLTSCLLVFNPARRCSAGQALGHPYVSRFNIDLNEPMMKADVIPPLREDLKLPIDEYRDKIYGLLRRGGSNDSETKRETTPTQKVSQRNTLCPVSPPKDLKETLKVESVKSQSPAPLQKVEIVAKTPPQQPRVEIVPKSRIPAHFHNGTSKMSSNDALNQIKEKRKTMLHKNRSLEETTTANVDNRRIKCRSSIARIKTDYQKKPNNRKSVI